MWEVGLTDFTGLQVPGALIGFIVILAIRGVCQRTSSSPLFWINPAFFLVPLFLCVVLLGVGFLLCCIRSIRKELHQITGRRMEQSITPLIVDAFRFTILPSALIWMVYLYYLYGCILSFMYVYNHFVNLPFIKRDFMNTSSSSWSYKDDIVSRLNAANHSFHSYKSTEYPTTSRICSKGVDEAKGGPIDDLSSSIISDEIEISFGPETNCENNNAGRSFYPFNRSRHQLDTVQEENESQGSQTSSETVIDARSCNAIRI
ncbi:hypothetical protein DICVIV_02633 [Dictyocaulus viviparus]|uniref:Uncharacterized protein n=1 Tax=Dictyocaulus viviparus TaxID=29172 RepID=A0A0D8Y2U7_DICVI|nr:hypothetical protein DICVIV_02633 [Dictyocaulus viviparus]